MSDNLHHAEHSIVPAIGTPPAPVGTECFEYGCWETPRVALKSGATYRDEITQRFITDEWVTPVDEWEQGDQALCAHHAEGMPFYVAGRYVGQFTN